MKHVLALALLATTLCGAAHAVDVYKWTDSKGVVHYGDRPASGVDAATVSVQGGGNSRHERAAAQARLEADRERLQDGDDSESESHAWRSHGQSMQRPVESACAASWREYDAAQSCFSANRVSGGKGVSGFGAAVCKEVPQPSCAR